MSGTPRPSNPYYDYVAVRDITMFFGREDELRSIYDMSEKKQSVSIVGPLRIGKSSILRHLGNPELQARVQHVLSQHIFISLDFRDYLHKTQDDFFRALCEQIVAQGHHFDDFAPIEQEGRDQFVRLLQTIDRAGFHPVLLMDAFDKVAQNSAFDPDFFSFMRGLATRGWVSYITASLKRLVEVCHPSVTSSPFFNIFDNHRLGPLTREEAFELAAVPTRRIGYPFTEEEIRWALKQAGRHPFFLQVTCRLLFDEKYRQTETALNWKTLQERVYEELRPHFDNAWDALSQMQQEELIRELRLQMDAPSKFPELTESALFRLHVRERVNVEEPDITTKDVKEALDNLEDNEFLANCRLATTHYILTLPDYTKVTSVHRRGGLVRDFLRAAFERLRATGVRSDGAFEWRSYNILYYHYFRYHLPNEQTAARLGVRSRRQFYREQDKAIQSLLKELLDMEKDALKL